MNLFFFINVLYLISIYTRLSMGSWMNGNFINNICKTIPVIKICSKFFRKIYLVLPYWNTLPTQIEGSKKFPKFRGYFQRGVSRRKAVVEQWKGSRRFNLSFWSAVYDDFSLNYWLSKPKWHSWLIFYYSWTNDCIVVLKTSKWPL